MITVIGMSGRHPVLPNTAVINTTSRSNSWSRGLSPFFLGPCELWGGNRALNVENAWQFSKVYAEHTHCGCPTAAWFTWAKAGWATKRAVRYPMGKGREPVYSYWNGEHLGYIEARKRIYVPLYWTAAGESHAFTELVSVAQTTEHVVLVDFDGYDYRSLGMTLDDVLNCETRKMGHAFVLAMMLEAMGIR